MSKPDEIRIRTFISPLLVKGSEHLTVLSKDGVDVCWLDCLFGGGIRIPTPLYKFEVRPLIWLISGPPGTGKTTFALELCHKLASLQQPTPINNMLNTAYFSVESPTELIQDNINNYGWEAPPPDNFSVLGEEKLSEITKPEGLLDALPSTRKDIRSRTDPVKYNLVVIDSLNVLLGKPDWSPESIYQSIKLQLKGRCWIVVLIQNREYVEGHDPFFAFVADIETRFTVERKKDYLLHYFRIVKMRFQEHAHGDHLVKIYGKPTEASHNIPAVDNIGLDRAIGGVYVLPSIHRHLSAVPRQTRELPVRGLPVSIDGFDSILPLGTDSTGTEQFGFPMHHCTAIVGSRGGMKSHVAYYVLIKHLISDLSSLGIMLSLRDDIPAAVNTLKQICSQEGIAPDQVDQLISTRRLNIVFFAPGYLPPEEFLHRVVTSIEEMLMVFKTDGSRIVAVLNGIDHLTARHPLCAAERVFVPGIISYLSSSNVTSIVIAATDDKEPIDESGLLPVADLLITFKAVDSDTGAQMSAVTVNRVPAGATGGGKGMLSRDPSTKKMSFRPGSF